MSHCVFMHRADSRYDDQPDRQYQFPQTYLGRAAGCEGDWIVYLEPSKVPKSRGYFAVARVARIVEDPTAPGMHLALIEPGTYLPFPEPVAFNAAEGPVERGLLNGQGRLSGRAQAAVRPISRADFARIVDRGLGDDYLPLPRVDADRPASHMAEELADFDYEFPRDRVGQLGSRLVRDRVFRTLVLRAYEERCAISGLRLINGGGRAEVQAAHIRPVHAGGPDIVSNGLALSGTAHWMFDRGLLSLTDDLEILISRAVNDRDSVRAFVHASGQASVPLRPADRPHPAFLRWHRENCYKG